MKFGNLPLAWRRKRPNQQRAAYATDPRAVKIATDVARLNEVRENWINPANLVTRMPEVVPGYPDRILPKEGVAAKERRERTLINLYNARPAWRDHAYRALDEAIAGVHGWGAGRLSSDAHPAAPYCSICAPTD